MTVQSLGSLIKLAETLKQQKMNVSRQRRQAENKLKQAISLGRKSTSGLSSVQKRLEQSKEKLGEITAEFNQILARKESLERLIKTAQERLLLESSAKDQTQVDLANAESEEAKQSASERLSQIDEKIGELESEIKQRQDAVQKLTDVIEKFKKSKTHTAQQIQKQTKSKPMLMTLIKNSKEESEKLKKQYEIASKKEDRVVKSLTKVNEKLASLMAKKAAAKKAAAKKAAAKKAAAKKAAAKKAAAKKAAAKKAAAKKAAAKKAAAKKNLKKPRRTTKKAATRKSKR